VTPRQFSSIWNKLFIGLNTTHYISAFQPTCMPNWVPSALCKIAATVCQK